MGGGSETEVDAESGTFEGTGTSSDPFLIENLEDLKTLAENVNNGTNYAGFHFKLTTDLDLGSEQWTPIGTKVDDGIRPFSGIFDGGDNTISNLNLAKTDGDYPTLYYGLFGIVSADEGNTGYTDPSQLYSDGIYDGSLIDESEYSAGVKNLNLSGINITARGHQVGALVGHIKNAYVSNISVSDGTISGGNSVGGIMGRALGCAIFSCSTGENLSVKTYDEMDSTKYSKLYNIGGIVGSLRGSNDNHTGNTCALIDCTNAADVSGILGTGGMGGIAGQESGNPILLYRCTNTGDITITKPCNSTMLKIYAGGIAGQFQCDSGIIAECTNAGTVLSQTTDMAGGLAGIVCYYNGIVVKSNNTGDVSGYAYHAAGIVAAAKVEQSLVIDGCTNTGSISSSGGEYSTICSGTDFTIYRNMEFSDTASLQDALTESAINSGAQSKCASITLQNITVMDASGQLTLGNIKSFISDNVVASEVVVTTVPTNNINPFDITLGIEYATISVNESVSSTKMLDVTGDVLEIINNGSFSEVKLTGDLGYVQNSGTVDKITIVGNTGGLDNSGTIRDSINITGDHQSATNGEGCMIPKMTMTGDYNTLQNDGTMVSITMTGDRNDIVNNGVVDTVYMDGLGQVLINNGMISSDSTYTIRVEGTGTTATINNYGTISNTGASGYIVFSTCADRILIVNFPGSLIQQVNCGEGHPWLFLYYGKDENSNTADVVEDKGVFELWYFENTVYYGTDGSGISIDVDTSRFYHQNNTDVEMILKEYTGTVAEFSLDVDWVVVNTDEGKVDVNPLQSKVSEWNGYTISWVNGAIEWDPSVVISGDYVVEGIITLNDFTASISATDSGSDKVLTVSSTHQADGITYEYIWSNGALGSEITVSEYATYEVTVIAKDDAQRIAIAMASYTFVDPSIESSIVEENPDGTKTESITYKPVQNSDGSETVVQSFVTKDGDTVIETIVVETTSSSIVDDSTGETTYFIVKTEIVTDSEGEETITSTKETITDSNRMIEIQTGSVSTSIQIPTTGANPSASVTIVQQGSDWSVDSSIIHAMDHLAELGDSDADVTITINLDASDIDLTIDGTSVSRLEEVRPSLYIQTKGGISIEFDEDTIAGLELGIVRIVAESAVSGELEPEQIEAIGEGTAYILFLTINDVYVDRFEGNAIVEVPFTIPDDKDEDDVRVYRVNSDGSRDSRDVLGYHNGLVKFRTNGFSTYLVKTVDNPIITPLPEEDPLPPAFVITPEKRDNSTEVACVAAAAVAAVLALILIVTSRKS